MSLADGQAVLRPLQVVHREASLSPELTAETLNPTGPVLGGFEPASQSLGLPWSSAARVDLSAHFL